MNDVNQDINYSRRGPWDVPAKEYYDKSPFSITVIIHNLENDTIDKEFELNYGNYEDRKFLGKITNWAIKNGRSVETIAKSDWISGK